MKIKRKTYVPPYFSCCKIEMQRILAGSGFGFEPPKPGGGDGDDDGGFFQGDNGGQDQRQAIQKFFDTEDYKETEYDNNLKSITPWN